MSYMKVFTLTEERVKKNRAFETMRREYYCTDTLGQDIHDIITQWSGKN